MFSYFKRSKTEPETVITEEPVIPAGYLRPEKAQVLLATPRRKKLLEFIWQRTAVSRAIFNKLYLLPIERYTSLVQQFPASESHHHSYLGGMLDHGLEVIAYALKLRQSYLLPIGSSTEEQAAQSEVWTAAIAYSALLHDIGKIAVDIEVETIDQKTWHPWYGELTVPYRFMYRKDREYRLHGAASGLLYNTILDEHILDWLNHYPELWKQLLYLLSGQHEYSGVLGEIVTKADQASVAQELGGDPAKAMSAPKHSLQRKLLDGLRYIIKEQLKLNQATASDGWLTDDALWLVSKTVSDKLRAHLLSQGVSGIPENNTAIFDVLQEHAIIQPTASDKAIWNATIKSDTGWSNHFTFLKVVPGLIWQNTADKPESYLGQVVVADSNESTEQSNIAPNNQSKEPVLNQFAPQVGESMATGLDSLLDLFEPNANNSRSSEPALTEITAPPPTLVSVPEASQVQFIPKPPVQPPQNIIEGTPGGEHFLIWLKDAILSHKLIINDSKASIHTVADTVFMVTPSIFMRYANEYPLVNEMAKKAELVNWRWMQKQFEALKVHRKNTDGFNIWTCQVSGQRKSNYVHGYLFNDPTILMPDIAYNNPYLSIVKKIELPK
ncbi:MobH family relaxase [Zophobihabitans entericus]|uniref:DNA-binding domain-containing protein n=1 Tax=Zophobihabitans entericus TaxID=1635327 RepID=A0A6G9IC81_9GAMM|nr:MobH family relaxase [Zophobihabitans entericus]QIQ21447.1 DNA-binding domain-containing protein [Zophobihabitans entericus]